MGDRRMLRVGEKKSINLINLAHWATLPSLIWINETACSFNSARCPQFSQIFADITPYLITVWPTLVKFQIVWLQLIELAWCGGDMGISGTWITAKCTFCARGTGIRFTILTKFTLFSDWLVTPSTPSRRCLILIFTTGTLCSHPYSYSIRVWISTCAYEAVL